MEYHFNIEYAKKYGVDEAIMIQNFVFWIMKNKANHTHQHEDRTWTYNTKKAFVALFPFWTYEQVKRILKSLIAQGVLIAGNFNKTPMDRTAWYAFKDEEAFIPIVVNPTMESGKSNNPLGQTAPPIPDIIPDIKPERRGDPPAPAEASPPRARSQTRGNSLSLSPEPENPDSLEEKCNRIHRKQKKVPLILNPQTWKDAKELAKQVGEADFLAGFEAFLKSDEPELKNKGYPFPWFIKQASQYIGKAKEGRIYEDIRIVPPEPLTDQERAEGEKILQELKEDFGSRKRGKNGRRCGESTEKGG